MKKSLLLKLFLITNISLSGQTKYILPCRADLLITSEKVAKAQVGVKEATGRNDGCQVEMYLKSVGLGKGSPYCAAGQYYCFYKACNILKLPLNYIPILRTGLANAIFNDGAKRGVESKYKPNRNDLLVWRRRNSISGHIERVIEVKTAGWALTIGFNTSSGKSGSQSEGQGVFIRKRNIYHPIGRLAVRGLIGFRTI